MASAEIKNWLNAKRRNALIRSSLYSMGALAGGVVVLLLTFGFFFLLAKIILLWVFPMAHFVNVLSAITAVLASALIFADGIRSVRDDMSILPLWFLREYFDIGPRVILDGARRATHALRLAQMDVEVCGIVLSYLAPRSTPASRDELTRAFPGLVWSRLVSQLQLVEGVIFFRPDAARVTLAMPLRLALRQLLPVEEEADVIGEDTQPIAVDEPERLGPCEMLGVSGAATIAEIKTAYRSRIKECHPDRFAGLDENSRRLAEEWTKALNAAYESLTARNRAGSRS